MSIKDAFSLLLAPFFDQDKYVLEVRQKTASNFSVHQEARAVMAVLGWRPSNGVNTRGVGVSCYGSRPRTHGGETALD